jgi:hypothetical protein
MTRSDCTNTFFSEFRVKPIPRYFNRMMVCACVTTISVQKKDQLLPAKGYLMKEMDRVIQEIIWATL